MSLFIRIFCRIIFYILKHNASHKFVRITKKIKYKVINGN